MHSANLIISSVLLSGPTRTTLALGIELFLPVNGAASSGLVIYWVLQKWCHLFMFSSLLMAFLSLYCCYLLFYLFIVVVIVTHWQNICEKYRCIFSPGKLIAQGYLDFFLGFFWFVGLFWVFFLCVCVCRFTCCLVGFFGVSFGHVHPYFIVKEQLKI